MQQQVVSGVEQGDQVINDRLDAVRQAGQTRVASLDPIGRARSSLGAVPTSPSWRRRPMRGRDLAHPHGAAASGTPSSGARCFRADGPRRPG